MKNTYVIAAVSLKTDRHGVETVGLALEASSIHQLRVLERATILPLVVVLRSILCGSAQRFRYWQLELRSSLCCGAQRKVVREDSGGLDWVSFRARGGVGG